MLKKEWGAESNGKLPHLSIPSKTAAWVPEFAVEDLPLSRIVALVPGFAVFFLAISHEPIFYISSILIVDYHCDSIFKINFIIGVS